MLHSFEQWSPLIIKRYLNDFFCTIWDEQFSTWPTDNFNNLFRLGQEVSYEKLSPLAKAEILKAYKLHQDKNKSSDFISHSRLEWNLSKWSRERIVDDELE